MIHFCISYQIRPRCCYSTPVLLGFQHKDSSSGKILSEEKGLNSGFTPKNFSEWKKVAQKNQKPRLRIKQWRQQNSRPAELDKKTVNSHLLLSNHMITSRMVNDSKVVQVMVQPVLFTLSGVWKTTLWCTFFSMFPKGQQFLDHLYSYAVC